MRTLLLLSTALLCGCGYDVDKFIGDMETVPCARYEECGMLDFFGGTIESCEQYNASYWESVQNVSDEWCVDYDKASAKQCVADWETISCDEISGGNTPAACDSVCSASDADAETEG